MLKFLVFKDTLVRKEYLEKKVNKDYLACLEKEALMDTLVLKASLVSQDSQELLDQKDLKFVEWL